MTTLNLADFGFRSLSTTGSMVGGSNQLTVASGAGFKVGDSIIVAVGGEAGDGMRGTVGVGGVYPATTTDPNLYYTNVDAPKALVAKIIGISADGTVLTLDRAAATSTTSADVFYNNKPAWDAAIASTTATGVTVKIPEGVFAVSETLSLVQRTGWTVEGAGKDLTEIMSPDGASSTGLRVFEADGTTVRDFHIRGNAQLNGYGLGGAGNGSPSSLDYPAGIQFVISDNCVVEDMKVTDVFQKAVGADWSTNVWAYRVEVVLTEGLGRYLQWQFQWSSSSGGGTVDCSVDSPILTAGFEAFASDGVSFIRPSGVNATMAMNSSGNFLIQDADLRFTENSWWNDLSFHKKNPIISINTNFDPDNPLIQSGGKIINAHIVQDGYINATYDTLRGIAVGVTSPNIQIIGGYYEAPDYHSGSTTEGPLAIASQGLNTLVDGFTVVGTPANGAPNIYVENGVVQNSVAERIIVVTNTGGGDTTAPNAPTISGFSPDTDAIGDGVTTAHELTLTGTAEANSKVKIFDGAVQIGTTTASGGGSWSFTTGTLSDGAHAFKATATDAAGNTSATSSILSVKVDALVDTLAPDAPDTGNDNINGENGNDNLFGGTGDDTIDGGNGADTLNPGSGTNTLTGGRGKDNFDFDSSALGTNTVTDFIVGQDHIRLLGDVDAHPVDSDEGVRLELDTGGVVILLGVQVDDLLLLL